MKKAGKKPSYMLEITPVFQDDWFGDTDPVTNRMITSRWAGQYYHHIQCTLSILSSLPPILYSI